MTATDAGLPGKGKFTPGEVVPLAPGVSRVVAPNPGMMTGPGTNSYLVGPPDALLVIDPGPAIDRHLDALMAAGRINAIVVTHTHPDHSPGAMPLAAATGAQLLGMPAPVGPHQDKSFVPDDVLADGAVIDGRGFRLRVVHTPGHASNHVCLLHETHRWLFTGDHVMGGSTVVIDPPDGDMSAYLDSLERLARIDLAAIAPGHGDVLDAPQAVIRWIVEHRLEREAKVVAALAAAPDETTAGLVPSVYRDVDASRFGLAERSLLAHLLKLETDGRARRTGDRWRLVEA